MNANETLARWFIYNNTVCRGTVALVDAEHGWTMIGVEDGQGDALGVFVDSRLVFPTALAAAVALEALMATALTAARVYLTSLRRAA